MGEGEKDHAVGAGGQAGDIETWLALECDLDGWLENVDFPQQPAGWARALREDISGEEPLNWLDFERSKRSTSGRAIAKAVVLCHIMTADERLASRAAEFRRDLPIDDVEFEWITDLMLNHPQQAQAQIEGLPYLIPRFTAWVKSEPEESTPYEGRVDATVAILDWVIATVPIERGRPGQATEPAAPPS